MSSQRPAPSNTLGPSAKQTSQPAARPQAHPPGPSQSAAPHSVKSEAMSRSDSGDGSALPTSANWAKNPQVEQSRRSSQAASRATPSPKVSHAKLAPQRSESRAERSKDIALSSSKTIPPSAVAQGGRETAPKSHISGASTSVCRLVEAIRAVTPESLAWSLDSSLLDQTTLDTIAKMPPMIDDQGGAVRLAMKRHQDSERQRQEADQNFTRAAQPVEDDEILASGSLQLGGEPDTAEERSNISADPQRLRGRASPGVPRAFGNHEHQFDGQNSLMNDLSGMGLGERAMTPQQQRNLALLRNNHGRQDSLFEQFQRPPPTGTSQHQSQLSNPFQNQNQLNAISRHGRHASRYTFANDTSSASTAVKPATNAQLLAQQSAMMPPNQQKSFPGQSQIQPNLQTSFYSGVQGPPPGLKSSGTPPISGGGMFGQGHGFASAMGGSAGFGFGNVAGKGSNDDLLRDIIRNRSGVMTNQGPENTKSEFYFSSLTPDTALSDPPHAAFPTSLNKDPSSFPCQTRATHTQGRSANRFSLRGDALDFPDPSIMQARMNLGGAGQGQFGGTQTQGGYNSHMMYNGGYGGRW